MQAEKHYALSILQKGLPPEKARIIPDKLFPRFPET